MAVIVARMRELGGRYELRLWITRVELSVLSPEE